MDSSVSLEDRIWFLRVCHHIPFSLYNRQITVHPAGFEPTVLEGERSQTHALDRAATETGSCYIQCPITDHSCRRSCTFAYVVYEQACRRRVVAKEHPTQAQAHD